MNAPTIPADAAYKNPALSIAARVRDLLARMTQAEKIAQLHGYWLILDEHGKHRVRPGPAFLGSSDEATLKQRLALGVGQSTRPLGTGGVDAAEGLRALNALQRHLKHETRLGIPALSHEECLVGLMCREGALFPSALALSATWNPALVEAVAGHGERVPRGRLSPGAGASPRCVPRRALGPHRGNLSAKIHIWSA